MHQFLQVATTSICSASKNLTLVQYYFQNLADTTAIAAIGNKISGRGCFDHVSLLSLYSPASEKPAESFLLFFFLDDGDGHHCASMVKLRRMRARPAGHLMESKTDGQQNGRALFFLGAYGTVATTTARACSELAYLQQRPC
jgi:hypothetical protein